MHKNRVGLLDQENKSKVIYFLLFGEKEGQQWELNSGPYAC
jgi:hypothetical protein